MMSNLAEIYDYEFFQDWGRKNEDYIVSARKIGLLLYETFQPKSLIDLGCGCGVYSDFFGQQGVQVVAIDGVQSPQEFSLFVPVEVCDLTSVFENIWGDFELTLCLDVAEHIPESYLEPFLHNLTRFSNTLVLSAAPPFQGGHHHVNEQPKRYWVQKLAEFGFKYQKKKTGQLLEKLKIDKIPYMWMGEHLSIYEKAEVPIKSKRNGKRKL